MKYAGPSAVQEIIADAGGRLIGRTRLQKCTCSLELTGLGYGFQFSYRHFGPYSEELQIACSDADALGLIEEQRKTATWGGHYSVFLTSSDAEKQRDADVHAARIDLLRVMTAANPVALELAVTAAFLAANEVDDAWHEVAERKEDKASKTALDAAKALYREMMAVRTPRPLPAIV